MCWIKVINLIDEGREKRGKDEKKMRKEESRIGSVNMKINLM